MTLSLHAGGYKASLDQIYAVQTPSPTKTHTPIPHFTFLEKVADCIRGYGYRIDDGQFGLKGSNGEDFFGVLTLNKSAETGDYAHVLGVRNSHRQRFSAQGILGTRVFVCDNLAFNSDSNILKFSRRHTTNILSDLQSKIYTHLGRLPELFASTEARIATWKETPLTKETAAHLLMRAFDGGAIATSNLTPTWREYNRPDGAGGHAQFQPRTLWSFYNAATEIEKNSTCPAATQRRTSRLTTILDALPTPEGEWSCATQN